MTRYRERPGYGSRKGPGIHSPETSVSSIIIIPYQYHTISIFSPLGFFHSLVLYTTTTPPPKPVGTLSRFTKKGRSWTSLPAKLSRQICTALDNQLSPSLSDHLAFRVPFFRDAQPSQGHLQATASSNPVLQYSILVACPAYSTTYI